MTPTTPAVDGLAAPLWHGEAPAVWRDRWGVPDLRIFRSLGSTNDAARILAEAGAPAGTVVLADEQTSGRGRRGRAWRSAPGKSLLLSFVLRPESSGATLPLRIGLAAARAIEAESGLEVAVKWPNDLLVYDRKVGGVLCEGIIEGGRTAFVIAGVGLNVLQTPDEWPPDLAGAATSLAEASGRPVSIPALAGSLVSEVSIAAAVRPTELLPEELDALAARDPLRGRDITVDGSPAGRAAGITPEGALLVERDGRPHSILTGTVRPAGPAGHPQREGA